MLSARRCTALLRRDAVKTRECVCAARRAVGDSDTYATPPCHLPPSRPHPPQASCIFDDTPPRPDARDARGNDRQRPLMTRNDYPSHFREGEAGGGPGRTRLTVPVQPQEAGVGQTRGLLAAVVATRPLPCFATRFITFLHLVNAIFLPCCSGYHLARSFSA